MGIFQRVVNMTRAAANEMLDKMENPVMMLNHYLRDLDEDIEKAERALIQQQVQERLFGSKLEEQNQQAHYYEGKAEQAAAEGREAEARAALEAKLLYLEQAEETDRLRGMAKQAAIDLQLRVDSLKEEKTRLQSKRAELVARVQKAASVSGGITPAAPHLQGSSAARGFERIEQKVMEWEAASELSKTAAGAGHSGYNAYGAGIDPKQEQRSALVEEQLQQLLKKSGS
ncbi:PspA/IM30 family protein [Paenibacillus nanensis]|uniref:PspA/IM30 family protein n=1 Tax=Paenibacillus nanensis TaxID=393251 RepID=A0A3A1UQE8_9BACL|nr:PspA/IM30 family protein [Paenibacillus nanensis]RIX50777.1 PspA/IM30 family protein [Paenibacillus nanensis]